MADEELLRRLDRMQATLELAFKSQLDTARDNVRADPASAALLDATSEIEWTRSGVVQKAALASSGVSERTLRIRLPELVAQHLLEVRGGGPAREYRRTGLV